MARMQEQEKDSPEQKEYKKNLRQLARPHLASPKHLLRYVQQNPAAFDLFKRLTGDS